MVILVGIVAQFMGGVVGVIIEHRFAYAIEKRMDGLRKQLRSRQKSITRQIRERVRRERRKRMIRKNVRKFRSVLSR